jgi:hypothetical protein
MSESTALAHAMLSPENARKKKQGHGHHTFDCALERLERPPPPCTQAHRQTDTQTDTPLSPPQLHSKSGPTPGQGKERAQQPPPEKDANERICEAMARMNSGLGVRV